MLRVEHIEAFNFEGAIRGLRNPMNSWDKSDSLLCGNIDNPDLILGQNDLDLMKRLYKAGTEHRKYLRQIFVSMDIVAPLYWWKEFDTYKVGTVANSCSTMHKIAAKEFELDDFSHEHLLDPGMELLEKNIEMLNKWRNLYLQGNPVFSKGDKIIWWQMIQSLPSSYNQRRTITMNYENVVTIIRQRTGHKLDEWKTLIDELRKLPYIEEIING